MPSCHQSGCHRAALAQRCRDRSRERGTSESLLLPRSHTEFPGAPCWSCSLCRSPLPTGPPRAAPPSSGSPFQGPLLREARTSGDSPLSRPRGLLPSGRSQISLLTCLFSVGPPGGTAAPCRSRVSSIPGPSARIRHSRRSVSIDQGTNSCMSALGTCKVTPDTSSAGRACKCQLLSPRGGLGLPDTGA